MATGGCLIFGLRLLILWQLKSTRGEPVKCTKEHISSALMSSANCMPRTRVLRLNPPFNMTVETMTPQYVSVLKCGGSCPSSAHSCVATQSESRQISYITANCGLESGVCEKECHIVTLQEELECACDCLQQQRECGPGQFFKSESCSCQCEDVAAAKVCKDSGRVWEVETCSCGCPLHTLQPCSTGFEFNNSTCSCIMLIPEPLDGPNADVDNRVQRDSSALFKVENFDMIIIAVLSCIIVLLLILAAVLVSALGNLKGRLHHLQSEQTLLPKIQNGDQSCRPAVVPAADHCCCGTGATEDRADERNSKCQLLSSAQPRSSCSYPPLLSAADCRQQHLLPD